MISRSVDDVDDGDDNGSDYEDHDGDIDLDDVGERCDDVGEGNVRQMLMESKRRASSHLQENQN